MLCLRSHKKVILVIFIFEKKNTKHLLFYTLPGIFNIWDKQVTARSAADYTTDPTLVTSMVRNQTVIKCGGFVLKHLRLKEIVLPLADKS